MQCLRDAACACTRGVRVHTLVGETSFLCLHVHLLSFKMPRMIALARGSWRVTCSYHSCFLFFTVGATVDLSEQWSVFGQSHWCCVTCVCTTLRTYLHLIIAVVARMSAYIHIHVLSSRSVFDQRLNWLTQGRCPVPSGRSDAVPRRVSTAQLRTGPQYARRFRWTTGDVRGSPDENVPVRNGVKCRLLEFLWGLV